MPNCSSFVGRGGLCSRLPLVSFTVFAVRETGFAWYIGLR